MASGIILSLSLVLILATAARTINRQDSDFYEVGVGAAAFRKNGQNNSDDTVDYLFSRKQATWESAVKGCKGFKNARLLSIETSQESDFVLDLINNDLLFDPPLPMGTAFWTSGAFNFKLSAWEWTSSGSNNKDNTKFGNWTQKLWAKDQPKIPIQPLDRIILEKNNLNHSNWKSLDSGKERAFYICEF